MFTRKLEQGGMADSRRTAMATGHPPQLPNASSNKPRQPSGSGSIIGPDLTVTGNLETTGEVRIEGEIQGDIQAARIVVGGQATITGALIADEIVIGGSVSGSIRGNKVTFQAASRIEGDVFHRSLVIEQGAYFEGKSRRSEDPMSVQRSASSMPPPG